MTDEYLLEGKRVLKEEADALLQLSRNLDSSFLKATDLLCSSKSHIVFSGVGKSGIIAQKMAATFSSTGTPSMFVHASEAFHGDSGMIPKNGVCVLISHSGNTEELIKIIPLIKRLDCQIISIISNKNSKLASHSNVILDTFVKKEACSLNLAPTTSTTATLALGDALAMAVMKKKGFTKEDFSIFHPGGLLGKSLLLRVEDLLRKGDKLPVVRVSDSAKDAIFEMSAKMLGMTVVVDEKGRLSGVITDGDLRRAIERGDDFFNSRCDDIMTKNPKTITKEVLAAKALKLMEDKKITSLIVVSGKVIEGVVTMHDIVSEGILS